MPKELRVTQYTPIVNAVLARAAELDVYIIARIQDSKSRSILVNNGKLERIGTGQGRGIGIQAFTKDGHNGFASSDNVTEAAAVELVETAVRLARAAAKYGTESNLAPFEVGGNGTHIVATDAQPLAETDIDAQVAAVMALNAEARQIAADDSNAAALADYIGGSPTKANVSVRSSHGVADIEWRIVRSDGTDYSFDTPHASASSSITATPPAGTEGQVVSVGGTVSGADAGVLLNSDYRARLSRRITKAAGLAHALTTAPQIASGHYKLIIDYALAKGLAHEAFGHASETDGMETSILGDNGKMRIGERVAAEIVTITDGPVLNDYAYQPISANGMPRQTVQIVKDGVLRAGLADLFSAARAGVPISGAERIESYRNLPVPRMSNIRITVKEPIPLDGVEFEEITPVMLRDILRQNRLMADGEQVLYLSGYRGGQVNPKTGDFVFNCASIYALTADTIRLHQPAIFSGKVLSALRSILAGIGGLMLDAQGTCGKAGQSVPSSGGANLFIVIDRNDDVTIGGT